MATSISGRLKISETVQQVLLVLAICVLAASLLFFTQGFEDRLVNTLPKPKYDLNDHAKSKSNLCKETFKSTLEENLEVVRGYPKGIAEQYMWKIGGNKTKPDTIRTIPVFVTAMDYKYYPYCQGMFKYLHNILRKERYKGKGKIIVFDMGLSTRQLRVLNEKCDCEIRRFPFEEFPSHVRRLKTYAFKPIVVQMMLMEFGFVWWTDISVKFLKFNLDNAFEYAKHNHMLLFAEKEHPSKVTIAQHTDIRTFDYLNEDTCKFRAYGEVYATTALFYFDEITKLFVQAWATCALNEACIAPVGEESLSCDFFDPSDGRCHRFDQSVLGILYRRLYHDQNKYPLDDNLFDIIRVDRREFFDYFERCRVEERCY